MKIVIDEDIPFIKGAFEPYAHVVYLQGAHINRNDVMDADALIVRTRTRCNAALLQNTSVRYIASATIGYDHIDTQWCAENGVEWSNAAGCNAQSVAQYVLAALLEMAKRKNIELAQKTIGIVGVGHVGSKVQQIAQTLGMRVLLNDPPREYNEGSNQFVSLETVAREADFITFHTPLTRQGHYKTYHLVNSDFISQLKKQVIVINTSRGEVINEADFKVALHNKYIDGAVLDVWENEPNIDIELLSMVDIATPHIAGYSADGKAKATEIVVDKIADFFSLPLVGWSVKNLSVPPNSNISIESSYKTLQNLLQHIVPFSYNILNDDSVLRFDYKDFEGLRKAYPMRREFSSYTLISNEVGELKNDIALVVNAIGFNILKSIN